MSAHARLRLTRDDDGAPSKLPCGSTLPLLPSAAAPPLKLGRFSFFEADDEDARTMSKELVEVDGSGRVTVLGKSPVFVSEAPCWQRALLRPGDGCALAPGAALLLQWGKPGAPRFVRLTLQAEAEAEEEAPAAARAASPPQPTCAKRAASPAADAALPEAKRARPQSLPAVAEVDAAAVATKRSDCQSCGDTVLAAEGGACEEGHFVCHDCFERHAATFANGELRLIEARKGLLYCPMHTEAGGGCAAPPLTLKQLQSRSAKTLESYIAMREKLTEKAAIDTAHATAVRQAACDAKRSPVERGVDFVRDMLNDKCPGCLHAFFDFDGCFALTCSHCKVGFCALCLKNCGLDAHPHLGAIGECPFGHGQFGSLDQLAESRRQRREFELWQYLDSPLHGFQLPDKRAARQQLLEGVKAEVEDRGVLGCPIAHFMCEANKPHSLRELAQRGRQGAAAAVGVGGGGGGQLIADPDVGGVDFGRFNFARIARHMRPPVPPPPAPPPPLPAVYCEVIAAKKGKPCKGCERVLPQHAAAFKLEVHTPVTIPDPITGQHMPVAINKITSEFYHMRCFREAHGHPARLYDAIRGRGLSLWPAEAQAKLYRLFPEPQHNRDAHADAAEARAAAAAAAAVEEEDAPEPGGSSGDEEKPGDVAHAPAWPDAGDDAMAGGSSGDEEEDDLLELPAAPTCGGACNAAPAPAPTPAAAPARGACASAAMPRSGGCRAPAAAKKGDDNNDEVILLD